MAIRASHVFRWDLDKTYLRTEFDTLRDLVKSALETAKDKQAYPGAPALLRALRQGAGRRVCIVSGSPAQMRQVLAAKLALDGIDFDEFVLKNNLRNIARLRFRALRAQVPYKLPALLESRARLFGTPPETLFGDDAEADAIIYSLYADILSGRVGGAELGRVLDAARAYDDQRARTLALAERLPRADSVQRILIHLDRRSPTAGFARFGARVVPIYNYFQAALILYGDHLLSPAQVLFVAREMMESRDYDESTLATSMQDLIRRGRLGRDGASALAHEMTTQAAAGRDVAGLAERLADAFAQRIRQLGDAPPLEQPAVNPVLDYVELVDGEYVSRRAKGRRPA
jgi:hypothetical protein